MLTCTCHVQAAIRDVSEELKQSTLQMTHSLKARLSLGFDHTRHSALLQHCLSMYHRNGQ